MGIERNKKRQKKGRDYKDGETRGSDDAEQTEKK